MPGTILVGVDASTPSRSAIAWSVSRAALTGADIQLLHVIERGWIEEGSREWADVLIKAGTLLQAELAYARGLDRGIRMTVTLAEGRPAEVLAQRSKGHSLLVVGTHKTGFIYGRAFGSRFLALGWSALCDVAFIPDRVGYDRHGVVAGIDDSLTGDAVILFAAAEAASSSQELVLVSSSPSSGSSSRSDSAVARRAGLLSRALALAKGSNAHLRVRSRVADHPTAEALIEASAGAALLVIGRRRALSENNWSWAVNHDTLLNMSSPVIVVLEAADADR